MYNRHFRPLSFIVFNTDYDYLPYRVRQLMTKIQGQLMDIRNTSKIPYRLYFYDDGCAIIDPLYNKVLCYYPYSSPVAILQYDLDELFKFWRYEKNLPNIKNRTEYNHWLSLKKQFSYE